MKKTEKTYHDNGNIHEERKLNEKCERHGIQRIYHVNGQLKAELNWTNGIQNDGEIISYHDNGIKARQVVLLNGDLNGEFSEWYENGQLKRHGYYENDQCFVTLMKFNNTTIKEATKEWLKDEKKAEKKYGGHISNWDVSQVTYMSFMFDGASSFNQPIGDWDVSQVTIWIICSMEQHPSINP